MKRVFTRIFAIMILSLVAACQQTSVPEVEIAQLPTLMILPSPTPAPSSTVTEGYNNQGVTGATRATTATQSATIAPTFTPSATITDTPEITPFIVTVTPMPTTTNTAASPATPLPARPASTLPETFTFGESVQGRPLTAWRIGEGNRAIMLVGGIHGGWESNTVTLVEQLIGHFSANRTQILPGFALVLVPSLNPDGALLGQTLAGRFNARGVDLNRNWGCGWSEEAYFRQSRVDPGDEPFSEPETAAMAALINDVRPEVVLFYHSAANGVFTGDCETGGVSEEMGAILGQATGYTYGESFGAYPVTGTAASWVDGLGIPSADVELVTSTSPEFERNLRGVMALQCWLLGSAAARVGVCR